MIKIYESVILKKIGFRENFPRSCLYLRRTALGIGLMKPRTIMAILALKLYIRHKQLGIKISRMLKVNEQVQYMQSGYSKHPVETPAEIKLPTKTWSDKIGRILSIRELYLENNDFNELKVTKN